MTGRALLELELEPLVISVIYDLKCRLPILSRAAPLLERRL